LAFKYFDFERVPDEGYARNMSCSHTWDIYIFIIIMLSPQVEGLKRHPFASKHEVFNDAIKR
jgi:hypothetical protein